MTPELRLLTPSPIQGLAGRADGQFLVVWSAPDGDGNGVFARRFDTQGQPVDDALRINAATAGDQSRISVDMTPGGDFVVVWVTGGDIFGRRFDANARPREGDLLLNAETAGVQTLPEVALDHAGGFVVTWWQGCGTPTCLWGRRFDAAGAPLTGDFEVGQTFGYLRNSVDADRVGNFVVAWVSYYSTWTRRYDRHGAPLSEPQRMPTQVSTDISVAVSTRGDDQPGSFVVAWDDFPYEGPLNGGSAQGLCNYCTRVRAFDQQGSGGPSFILRESSFFEGNPSVARQPTGRYIVVWDQVSIRGQFFTGQPIFTSGFETGGPGGWTVTEGEAPTREAPVREAVP